MPREVTVIGNYTGAVQIGILEETGRRYYHVRFIAGALVGDTTPSQETSKVSIAGVEVLDGFRFDLLSDYVVRTSAALLWQAERQGALTDIQHEADSKRNKQVELAIRKWERDHPRPEATQPPPTPEPLPDPVPVGEAEFDPGQVAEPLGIILDRDPDLHQFPPLNEGEAEAKAPPPAYWDVGAGVLVRDTFDFVQIMQANFEANKWLYVVRDDAGDLKSYSQDQLESTETAVEQGG